MRRTRSKVKVEREIRRRVGAAIEQRRLARGFGVDALAKAAEVDTSQMAKVLRGECGVSLYSLARISHALGCTPAEILSAFDSPAQPTN